MTGPPSTASTPELAGELARHWAELARTLASRKLVASLHPTLSAKLSPGGLHALLLLAEAPGPRISELAHGLGLDESTATRLVDRLEALALARRRPAEDDRRSTVVALTKSGRAAAATLRSERRGFLEEILSALDPDERTEFVRLTGKAAGALRERADEVIGQ